MFLACLVGLSSLRSKHFRRLFYARSSRAFFAFWPHISRAFKPAESPMETLATKAMASPAEITNIAREVP